MNPYVKEIIKHLDRVQSSGNRPSAIFEDWLDIVHATMKSIPSHLRSAMLDHTLAPDTPEAQELFARLHERYKGEYCWEHFAKAFNALLDSADGEDGAIIWDDTIGDVYMEWGVPNKYTGQFFTPFHVARLMAMVSMENIEDEIYGRIEAAYLKSPTGALHEILSGRERVTAFVRQMGADLLSVCAEHIEPLTVCDPCCGSGVMLLAAAEQCPRWALNWGLVQFYGQDIDATCVKMAQINSMIYGLNGYNLKNALELSQAEIASLPEPYASAYTEAQANPERAEDITAELRGWRQEALL